MIYYFSGTGNSRFAAQKLAVLTEDKSVNIASIYNGTVKSVEGKADVTGFVFPVYYSGLPEMVKRFASNPQIKENLGEYVFCVITCGGSAAAADKMLAKALCREPDLSVSLMMPDNYVIAYDPSTADEAREKLGKANAKLEKIAEAINQRGVYISSTFKKSLATKLMYPFYNIFRTTRFYKADSKCNGCGFCEKICPDKAIEIKSGKPVWVNKKCQHCTACINRCPQKAIQFGFSTKKRGRYYIADINK